MKVRPMGMGVNRWLVCMLVRVPPIDRNSLMEMGMMTVVMAVPMHVDFGHMGMSMRVAIHEEECEGANEENSGNAVARRHRFPEKHDGQDDPKERCARKDYLASGGSEALGGRDVEGDARAVGQRPQDERGCDGRT